MAASRIVGKYDEGAILALANDLSLSRMQVYRRARAGWTYRVLRRFNVKVKLARKKLTFSHFAVMGEMISKHDLPPFEAVAQLITAAEEGASVELLRTAIEGEHKTYEPDWVKQLSRLKKLAEKLKKDQDAPIQVQEAVIHLLDRLEGVA